MKSIFSLPPHLTAAAGKAFRDTIPILIGFAFLGFSYGVYMHSLGFPPLLTVVMALTIFAGSLEFIMASMLTGGFAPLTALLVGLTVNARHLFYSIAMLSRYQGAGRLKPYLIYGLVDETFSLVGGNEVPPHIEKRWYCFFVTLFNEIYWVTASALGAYFGSDLPLDLRGIEFVLPALFLAIFAENWRREQGHACSITGIAASLSCLLLFGSQYFLLPSMALIILLLMLMRRRLDSISAPGDKI